MAVGWRTKLFICLSNVLLPLVVKKCRRQQIGDDVDDVDDVDDDVDDDDRNNDDVDSYASGIDDSKLGGATGKIVNKQPLSLCL